MNLLLLGKHGTNVDTIIFANIDHESRKVSLVSVPRDLYYKGRKINSVYADYGVNEQVRWVEEILGHKIHHYALIDMYVFSDVIDLMGGVDVKLEQDLADPSYRTCDNGVCGTLYYEAGEHHLSGVQALRVARSRYTSSDYSRAERQQIILAGIQDKAQSLGFGDADKLLAIISEGLDSVDTDLPLNLAIQYYFRYQNFEIDRGNVLSTGNVLASTRQPVNFVTSLKTTTCLDEEVDSTCKETYAIYTLSPRNDDWNVIKWYVNSLLR